MNVRVRLFALAKQEADSDVLELPLSGPVTIAELRAALLDRLPALRGLGAQIRFAVNAEFAGDDRVIEPGDDVACIPPVSGG